MYLKMLEANYQKNLQALQTKNPSLHDRLVLCTENKEFNFDISSSGVVTILDNQNRRRVNLTLEELSNILETFDSLTNHPYLYFFGISDGMLQKALLNTKKHALIVIEPKLELIFIALHCQDFSNEILSDKLYLFLAEDLSFPFLVLFLHQNDFIYYVKSYILHFPSPYYEESFDDEIMALNQLMLKTMEYIISNAGNDIIDGLTGLKNHIANLPHMVAGPQLQKFCMHKNTDIAVMVSTGPSLSKQLPLLRSIQENVTIICADSALRILYQNGITADICTSMERDELITRLFEDIPSEYKQKVIFVRASLQNPSMFSVLEGCTDILAMRPFGYNDSFNLHPYGYICSGMSVANMSHDLIALMRFRACIIIGQDLAYGKDGTTHSKGYTFGETFDAVYEETGRSIITLPAYGGEGTVESNTIWELFLNGLRQGIASTKNIFPTINATEGGARIEGSLEMSFADSVKEYVDSSFCKQPINVPCTSHEEAKEYFISVSSTIDNLISEGEKLQGILESTFMAIAEPCKKLENKSEEEQLETFNDQEIIGMLNIISETREALLNSTEYKNFYWDIIQTIAIHHEIELGTIKTLNVTNPSENKNKAIRWIFNHIPYFYTLAGSIDNVINIMREEREESLQKLPEELKFLVKN
ncbi:MAG: hypothetical protein A2023_05100 [Sulfuricurvum sp. GWF2_44_89]|uniref:6-hydroxymethylpterin diphosphokinase MptE-like domain-containing protein n=1 Tax=Sulfuricurvum kujiense TaxID=148813 RepID=A0A2D3WKF5_9BACT|nr:MULTISPECIES: 6-hydroxymethylpterin diphosphokinase MptE-like protein [Sulfuricurvum]OHD77587.1 MAG: hypothetical protein A2023_05100 [Sulfuricurvum sp. GWF2_44_89]OHD90351.1 MAG: hypothetical protein A2517_01515 [Sulfuricurvum sp. RIFOXYD12_FULL_44_77]OHD92341.1 MAG: hypothetical protein A2552_08975 [Sulfuricurvum sp. RIFOXYD2_FULL_44_160]DAB37589.1 MAG TPA: hypothetical protein CFH83_10315 [Sulfuricurvum kujiense]